MGMFTYLCIYFEEPKKLKSQTIILFQIKFSGVKKKVVLLSHRKFLIKLEMLKIVRMETIREKTRMDCIGKKMGREDLD